jgi:hypothetical protein
MEAKLASTHLSGQDVHAPLRSDSWNAFDSRNAQLVFLNIGHLADFFGLSRDRMRKVREKWKLVSRPLDPPLSLAQYQEQIRCTFMREASVTGNSVTPRELLDFIDENYPKT